MSAEETRKNKKSPTNANRNHVSNKERATKPADAHRSRHHPNQKHVEGKISKTDYNQPIGEFSDWNKQRS